MELFKKIRSQLTPSLSGPATTMKMLGGCALLSGLLAVFWDLNSKPEDTQVKSEREPDTADTFIPAGHVLVPIEIINYESLDSILGNYGIVDLFLPASAPGGRPQKIANRIKILRAPLNPRNFAVLAPETQSADLVRHEGAFFVVVQNPKQTGTGFVKGKAKRRHSRIVIEGD